MKIRLYTLQKIIMWIPGLNIFVFYIWAVNQYLGKSHLKTAVSVGITSVTLVCTMIVGGLEMWVYNLIFKAPAAWQEYIFYYIITSTIATFCVLSQKVMLICYEKQQKEKNDHK